MLSHTEYLGLRRFPALDGLRAIAATMVVFFHYGGPAAVPLTGWIGVHIFFVLSGFLITTLLLREEHRSGQRPSLWKFYVRRSARILPVYYVVLGIVVVLFVARGEYTSSGLSVDVPYYATFLGEFVAPTQPHSQVWTLGIEQKFYLLWPLLAFGLVLPFGLRIAAVIAAGLVPLVCWQFLGWGTMVHYVVLVIGAGLAVVAHDRRGWRVLKPLSLCQPAG